MFILAPKAGGPAYKKAAEIFRDLYAQITGTELSVKTTPSDTEDMVVIGADDVQPFAFAKLDGGFPVRSGTDDYCIISQKEGGRNFLFIAGGRGRSTLYGVYDFFERRAGCHYFWDGDVIPHKDTIDITDLHIVESPRFQYRAIRYFAHRGLTRFQAEHWDWEEWKREIDWLVKARLNTFMLRIGMDDIFQKAFPDIVPYPPEDEKLPGAGTGYNNRTTAWPLQYRGQLRKKVMDYAFQHDLMHPEDFGTMTHWYSRTPVKFLEAEKPTLMSQVSSTYSEQTGQVWDIFDDKNVENYMKLTEASVKEYGRPDLFHTIGLAERKFSDDPKKNLELKKFAYKRFLTHIHENHPNAKVLIAAWDFYFRLTPEEVQEIVKMFDPDNTLILDYTVDLKFEKSNMDKWGIMGNFPWIFGLFHGYMPQTNTHGDYDFIEKKIAQADADPCCKGMDFWPEMSHSDTLMLAYFAENAWKPTGRSISQVASTMCQNRYGENAEVMDDIWQSFVPMLNLADIDYTSCVFNLLKSGIIRSLADVNHPNHEKAMEKWSKVVAEQKPYNKQIVALLEKIKALPKDVLEARFVLRDCVDLIRSALTQKLHIDYIDACITLAEGEKDAAVAKFAANRKLLEGFARVLSAHSDYSMYETLCHQGKNRKVNPYFEDALKDNILNDYCRTAAYELVAFVYTKEADVLAAWAEKSEKGAAVPAEDFLAEREKIFDAFKALPLKNMHPAEPSDLYTTIDDLLKEEELWN